MTENREEVYLINKVTLEILKVLSFENETWIENYKKERIFTSIDDLVNTGKWAIVDLSINNDKDLESDHTITTEDGGTLKNGDFVYTVYESMINSFGLDSIFKEVVHKNIIKNGVKHFTDLSNAEGYIIINKKFLSISDVVASLKGHSFHKSHIENLIVDLTNKFKNS